MTAQRVPTNEIERQTSCLIRLLLTPQRAGSGSSAKVSLPAPLQQADGRETRARRQLPSAPRAAAAHQRFAGGPLLLPGRPFTLLGSCCCTVGSPAEPTVPWPGGGPLFPPGAPLMPAPLADDNDLSP